jgi:hypothetical protein
MKAGNNLRARIWRFSYPADDSVGGAVPSGTIVYESVQARSQDASPIAAFAIQGVETNKVHQALVFPGTLDIREYDQFEIISSPNHPYYGLKMRIDTVQKSNFHPSDPRGYLLLTMVRATKHGNDYQ